MFFSRRKKRGRRPKPKGLAAKLRRAAGLLILFLVLAGTGGVIIRLQGLSLGQLLNLEGKLPSFGGQLPLTVNLSRLRRWRDDRAKLTTTNPDRIEGEKTARSPALVVALLSDSHESNQNLQSALSIAKERNVSLVVHLGDLSRVGDQKELEVAKEYLQDSNLDYHLVPGDHDLWASVGPENFEVVFGKTYESFSVAGVRFILINNADNYLGLDEIQLDWVREKLRESEETTLVFLHKPLYHPESSRVMGWINGERARLPAEQAEELLDLIRQNDQIVAIFAGDLHRFSRYTDTKRESLEHIVLGALDAERNLELPNFSLLTVFDDGRYELERIILSSPLTESVEEPR